ncbi:MAG: HAD family hydrolase [Solirubrobacteraceae bacterium]
MAPRLVIFDCDGVLVDSETISARVLAGALTAVGLTTSADDALERYKGAHLRELAEDAQQRLGRPLPEGFLAAFERDRAREFRRSLRAIDGAAETVRAVTDAGLGVCVASQGRIEKTELTLGLTGLRPLFGEHALFSSYSVTRGKPYPDLYLYAAEQMRTDPADCVVVEDSAIGITAGISAGMRVFGYAADNGNGNSDGGSAPGDARAELLRSLPELCGRLGL